MNPLLRTVVGVGAGWAASKSVAVVSRLQGDHTTLARKLHSRRSFTRNATLGATGIVLAQLGVAFGVLMWPNKTGAFGGEITVGGDVVPEVGGDPFRHQEGQFYLVHTEDGIEALWWKCVHLGCTVPWNAGAGEFHCPCHGSVFEYNGARISGPATRAMDLMPTTVDENGAITVNTDPGSIIERATYQPEHATQYP